MKSHLATGCDHHILLCSAGHSWSAEVVGNAGAGYLVLGHITGLTFSRHQITDPHKM